MDLLARDALIERLRDAFEDQGMYAPAPEIVEGVYEDAVEPLRQQLAGAVEDRDHFERALERIFHGSEDHAWEDARKALETRPSRASLNVETADTHTTQGEANGIQP
jgi:hypothetical protein